MSDPTYLLGIAVCMISLLFIIEMLRKNRLKERHAVWWLLLGILALFVSLFPVSLAYFASLLGVEVPSNLAFFTCIVVLFMVSIQQSGELTSSDEKLRIIAEKYSMLEMKIRRLESENLD